MLVTSRLWLLARFAVLRLKERGAVGFAVQCLRIAVRAARQDPKSDFDASMSVDTDGIIQPWDLEVSSANHIYAVKYEPTPTDIFSRAIEALRIDCSQFTFVDLGAGKGRVLLLAGRYAFPKILGVEFAPKLAQVAHRNIENSGLGGRAEVVCIDAIEFDLPKENLVVYMFNPFAFEVMTLMLPKFERHKQSLYVIYCNPVHDSLFHYSFTKVCELEGRFRTVIYRNVSALGGC
jgi:SAM-dependent methyltransferase